MNTSDFARILEQWLTGPFGERLDVVGGDFMKKGDGFEIVVWLDSSFDKAPADLQEEYLDEFVEAWKADTLGYRYDFLRPYEDSDNGIFENPDSLGADLDKAIEMWKDRFVELYSCYLEADVSPVTENRCGVQIRKYWIDNGGFETEEFEKTVDADLSVFEEDEDAIRWLSRNFGDGLKKKRESAQPSFPGFEASCGRVAKRIALTAKTMLAGGGSGIRLNINEFSGHLDSFKIVGNKEKWRVSSGFNYGGASPFVIDSFDALGYADGMYGVDGKKVFSSIDINDAQVFSEIGKMIADNFDRDGFAEALEKGEVVVEVNPVKSSENIIFGGWSRGNGLKEGDAIEFKYEFEMIFDWDGGFDNQTFDLDVYGTLSKDGAVWYQHAFEYIPQDLTEAEDNEDWLREEFGA